MADETRYPCPCCGYMTFYIPSPGTYQTCPVCCWEDRDYSGLSWAQRNFEEFGACQQQHTHRVRPPTLEEARNPDWQPLYVLAGAALPHIREQIALAFDGVQREDGITIHEAYKNEDSRGPLTHYPELQKLDTDTRWQDVPEQLLASRLWHSYLDKKGWKYYLPAAMLFALKHYGNPDIDVDAVIYMTTFDVENEKSKAFRFSFFECLTVQQAQAVCQFLRFMVNCGSSLDDVVASQALEHYWGKFCSASEG